MITLEGFVGKIRYSSGDYRIYPFYPLAKYQELVKIDPKYKNISISGEMPEMYENMEYKLDVEYVKNGRYDNYVFKKMHNTKMDFNGDITNKFLSSILSKKQTDEILKHYPNIINMVLSNKPIDVSKLHGIKEKTLSVIKRKIIENFKLIELVEEYKEYGMTFTMMKNLYDTYSSIDKIKKKMEEDPYTCLCRLNRVGFKTADDFIMKKYPNKISSRMRAEACINYILMENENSGNTWINVIDLYKSFKVLAPEANMHFKDILNENEDIYYKEETKRVALRESYICEKEICNMINEFKETNIEWNINYEKYNEVDNAPLTEEQMKIIKNVCKYNINILTGFGGTGKSFSVKALINMLDDNMITYALMTPTGKASKVLSKYTGKQATTIHRGLRYNPSEGFYYNKKNKLPFDVIIVDEYSMIDIFLLRDLLRAVDTKSKIVFIGDPAQIPSVGVGNIAFDMLESESLHTALLSKVFRYGEGGLSYVASKIRQGEKYIDDKKTLQTFGKNKDYTFVNTLQENSIDCLKSLYKNMMNKGYSCDDILVLSAYNKGEYGTLKLNNIIQDMVNPWDGKSNQISVKRNNEDMTFRINDRVMQCKNNYKAITKDTDEVSIFNGDTGTIKEIKNDTLVVDFYGVLIVYEKSQLDQLNLAYSLTFHKSQGSSCKSVIMITPKAHKFFLDRNLLYVAASRAEETLYHIGSVDVIESSLKKSQNFNRNTFLKDMLENKP